MSVVALASHQGPVEAIVTLSLGMAQLSPVGLSEQWFLRFCGDQHWALIAKALGQRNSVFHAADARPVYAAFCATSLRLHAQSQPLLGQDAQIISRLFAITETRTGSQHQLIAAGQVISELSMISTFVSHDLSGSNTRIYRNTVLGDMHLPQAEAELMQLDQKSRDTARNLRKERVKIAYDNALEIHSERPIPSLDFNAVGLLYFPTFSRIAETAAYNGSGFTDPNFQRNVVYLGNINQGDTVHVFDHGAMMVMTRGDGALIATVRSLSIPI